MSESEVPSKLNGQYIGRYTNVSSGEWSFLCVNIDATEATKHEARGTIFAGDRIYVATFSFDWPEVIDSYIKISDIQEFVLQKNGDLKKSDAIGHCYASAELYITWQQGSLRLTWETNNEKMQSDGLVVTSSAESNLFAEQLQTWDDFKRKIGQLVPLRRYIFRGQSVTKRLRTSFHRAGHFNIARYYNYYIPELAHQLSVIDGDYLELTNNRRLLSLLTLAQHHGYPTPILDWTFSPYIAAYFAFHGTGKQGTNKYIRIYLFDLAEYQKDFPHASGIDKVTLNDMNLNVSFIATLPHNNPRAVPQQSISCVSPVDDFETYMEWLKENNKKKEPYLIAYDIPTSEATTALNDLEFMGITHASLFPGLDGICAYLRRKHFESSRDEQVT